MYNDKVKGCVFGLAIGDAVGLRYENVKPNWINEKNIGKVCFGGAISDDTEHMFLISKSILKTNNIIDFKNYFRKELQKWIFSLPVNIGKTTGISIIRSFFKSGYGVAGTGNGSVMRIAPVGLIFHNDILSLNDYAEASCRITHNSDESVVNSIAIARLIAYIINKEINEKNKPKLSDVIELLKSISPAKFWIDTIFELEESINNNIEPIELVNKWTHGNGASGYTKYSTLLSIYCWWKYYGDYEKTITEIIKCGGDTDTNAAIVGAIVGVTIGYKNIPKSLNSKVKDLIIRNITLNKLSDSITNKTSDVSTWKIHCFGIFKNIFSLFYFSVLILKVLIFLLFRIKH